LALERGEQVSSNAYDDHEYLIKRLVARMREADFKFLDQQIQMAYQQVIQEHEQARAEQERKLLAAKDQYIPTEGPLVKADVYIANPKNSTEQPKRAQIPQRALEWLITRLDDQGNSLDRLEQMNKQSLVEMAGMINPQMGAQPMPQLSVPQGSQSVPQGPEGR